MPDTSQTTEEDRTETAAAKAMRFVGIGSSAGGLEAVSLLAQNLPQDANAVYIVAQHMSPSHKSVLTSLISRETKLNVQELSPETFPEPNTIYVGPPNTDVIYDGEAIRLRNPSGHPATPKPSADRLFKSLAEHCKENSVGIVLSGTGSDGSYGVQAIREEGGITIAQEPATAKYDGMPSSAIETGCIDLTLPPEMIGRHLEKILALPRNLAGLRDIKDTPNPLAELIGILHARTKVDFTDYKESTLNRRVARRMNALGIKDYDSYVDHCRANAQEVDALHRDLLISVTRFFRDPEQFSSLRAEMGKVLKTRGDHPLRIWIVGCATGEEAYSIGIELAELLGGLDNLIKRKVQIFATDIDQTAIEVGRRGVYPITAAHDIPPAYMAKYFIVSENEIAVRPELRSVTLFSHHNVFQDPPFINADVVSIRNVLIYFNQALQERVLSRLHYALAGGGLLFLGTSETVGEMSVYFESREGADKVFSKRRGTRAQIKVETGARTYYAATRQSGDGHDRTVEHGDSAEISLAKAVAPNGLICTRNGAIIEVLGDISPFVEIRSGASTALTIKMLREPLRTEALSLVAVALRNEARRDGRWHEISLPVGNRVQLQAYPYATQAGGEHQCLLAINANFEEQSAEANFEGNSNDDQLAYIERMEREVKATQEALQQTIEELQTSKEELQSANEELQSTNEEFQATNEELETANEELQSTNEELLTVNEELQISSTERFALASELQATLTTSPYAIALADQALMIRRASDAALSFLGLDEVPPSGIHLSQCALPAGFPALAPIANAVLRLQESRRTPVLSDGTCYSLVMTPVHDAHKKLIGLSIAVTEYDGAPLERVLSLMTSVSKAAHWTYNLDAEELLWSPGMFKIFDRPPSGAGPTWEQSMNMVHPADRESLNAKLQNLLDGGKDFDYMARMFNESGKVLHIKGSTTLIRDSAGQAAQLVGVMWDAAESVEAKLQIANLRAVQEDLNIGFFSVDVENNLRVWSDATFRILGYQTVVDQPSVESFVRALAEEDRETVMNGFIGLVRDGAPFEVRSRIGQGELAGKPCEIRGRAWEGQGDHVSHIYGSIRVLPET